ncbi:PREDICTED: pentatricopeptide repeat-containing protein At1g08070, chloroplastic-like [Nelumbo nucifera]|nr:PREDICTED: pentatricopeptide repeat-containing protein At1g08070, chloroplastic-like [Nelumbo nucifera]
MNCLLDMYSKCGFVDEARRLYDEMTERDIVSHTSMISGYFSIGDLASARLIFDRVEGADVVLWSAMVAGYTQNRCPKEALDMFDQMQSLGLRPNSVTMVGVISACSQLGDIERGRRAHDYLVRTGMEMNTVVSTSLLDMYIKCGFIDEARELFDRMPRKDVVSWNALINGYTKNGYFKEALEVFNTIQDLGLEPNKVTFLSALSSCAELGAIEKGKEIEELLNMSELGSDLSIETALLDMYAKCGSIAESYNVFRRTFPRDVVMWSAMINGFATNGHFKAAMSLFGGMLKEGMRPNNFTFLSLLIACAHGGLVHEAYEYLNSMTIEYGISPNMEHYACMVDLLGRAGLLEDAKKFIDGMPIEPGISVWRSLLGACTTHKNTKIGEYAAQHLFELEPKDDANYVLLSNIYAASGRWEDVEDTRAAMKHHKAHKTPGCSWIENGGKIHEFLVGGMLSGMELQ